MISIHNIYCNEQTWISGPAIAQWIRQRLPSCRIGSNPRHTIIAFFFCSQICVIIIERRFDEARFWPMLKNSPKEDGGEFWLAEPIFLKKWSNPGLFFVYFWSFQTNIPNFYNKYMWKFFPSSIRCRDSNLTFGTWVSSHNHYTRAPALNRFFANQNKLADTLLMQAACLWLQSLFVTVSIRW